MLVWLLPSQASGGIWIFLVIDNMIVDNVLS